VTRPGRFQFVSFDRDSDVRVGDWVVAVGNPFGLDGTATAGIVSAIGRRQGGTAYVDYLQIDAPINRGNSGGPTFDLRGRVIGVNSAIFSPTGGNVGIGFAIPSEIAARIVEQLMDGGRVTRGWLGVSIQTQLDQDLASSLGLSEPRGALIASVAEGGPAARAGVQQGDVVLSFNGERIEDIRDLTRRVGATAINENVRLEVLRSGQRRNLNVRLGERPSEEILAANNAGPTDRPEPSATTPPAASQAQSALGVSVRLLTDADRARYELEVGETGLVITAMAPTSALAEKLVQPGDIILQAGGQPVRSVEQLSQAITAANAASRPLLLQVESRGGQRRYLAVEVDAD
jgi:serine protease Do